MNANCPRRSGTLLRCTHDHVIDLMIGRPRGNGSGLSALTTENDAGALIERKDDLCPVTAKARTHQGICVGMRLDCDDRVVAGHEKLTGCRIKHVIAVIRIQYLGDQKSALQAKEQVISVRLLRDALIVTCDERSQPVDVA